MSVQNGRDSWNPQEKEMIAILDKLALQANNPNQANEFEKLITDLNTQKNPELIQKLSQYVRENDISADSGEVVIDELFNLIETESQIEFDLVTNDNKSHQLAQKILAPKFPESEDIQLNNLIEEILSWTGNQSKLIEIVCQLMIDEKNSLQQKEQSIEELIQRNLIENWQQGYAVEHLMEMRSQLLDRDGYVVPRLETYKQILQEDPVNADEKPETLALLQAGLIINNDGWLKVANRIYQETLNPRWVKQELDNIAQIEDQAAPPTIILSLLALVLFIVGGILYLLYSKQETVPFYNPNPTGTETKSPEICRTSNLGINLKIRIQELKNLQKEDSQKFSSEECQTQLQELEFISDAIGYSRNSIVANNPGDNNDAIDFLCKIPQNSINMAEAKYWVNRWYSDQNWKSDIDKALQNNLQCEKLIKFENK